MARPLDFPDQFSPFSRWMNSLRNGELDPHRYEFSFTDLDAIIWRLGQREDLLMLIEVKTRGVRALRWSQREALNRLHVGLARDRGRFKYRFTSDGAEHDVRYLGMFLLSMDGEDPDCSSRLGWGTRAQQEEIDRQTLIEILRFDRDPCGPHRFLTTPESPSRSVAR